MALFILVGFCLACGNAELSGLLSALQYLGLDLNSNGTGSAHLAHLSRGTCDYTFESYALMRERHTCVPDDEYIIHLSDLPQQRKPPIRIKCLQPEAVPTTAITPISGNDTSNLPKLLIMKSAKEIVNLLKPIGNATKRHEAGSCVVVHFCTPTSLECARVAPVVNLLPHLFPSLPVAYIDASEFIRFNAEFGIVSLPTLMIFHQGRPLIKYDPPWHESTKVSFGRFILRHTNIKTVDLKGIHPVVLQMVTYGPLSNVPVVKTDFYLGLAWAFILLCLANYARRTPMWKQLVEMVQRNWRESEETQMEMVD